MAITNFIPTIWSENLMTALDKKYIAVAHCNRDYEGEIKGKGSVVKICGIGAISISNYTKDTDMSTPQPLTDTVTELEIDRAKYFNFQIDDIDKAQCSPKLMDAAMALAASALANEADSAVFGMYSQTENIVECSGNDSILDKIIEARQMLYENNVSDSMEVVLEVSPAVASKILKAKLTLPCYDSTVADAGYLGSFAGCKIYVSNNICVDTDSETNVNTYKCLMRTTRAVAFAEQFSQIDAYRPEKRFADAVKGLHLYGVKAVYPSEIISLNVSC